MMGADDFAVDYAGEIAGIVIHGQQLQSGLSRGQERTMRAAEIIAQRDAPEIENYMKINAPWTDRTGNARNGLAARAYRDRDEVGIVLFHQVDYGIYLEIRFDGKFAIIQPTIDAMGPKVMRDFERLLDRI
jgi:hypothetical protein